MKYNVEKIDASPARLKVYASVLRFGENQAISQKELADRWGCSDRAVRIIVALIRKNRIGGGVLVASQSGYFFSEDSMTIRKWIKTAKQKSRSLELIAEDAEKVLHELEGAEL